MTRSQRQHAWTALGIMLTLGAVAWGLTLGSWAYEELLAAMRAVPVEPRGLRWLPPMHTDYLTAPFAPVHALIARGDAEPLAAALAFGLGLAGLWKSAQLAFRRAPRAKKGDFNN